MTQLFDHLYASFLDQVAKPTRYTGSEHGVVRKDWDAVDARFCLAFPDIYDIGMSHLGYRILYKLLNDHPRILAERCYTPWLDMQEKLKEHGLPLASLENVRPLSDFDVIGFSLQFELTYTNILLMLDLGGVPLRSSQRGEDDPLVIAGGPVATHAEPMAPFLDAILIGDGEEAATEIALSWVDGKKAGLSRAERLKRLSKLAGVYVPSLYETEIEPKTGFFVVAPPQDPSLPYPIERRLVPDINDYPFPDDFPVGGPEAIFDRMSIEVARGCTEGCRFCQAGMIYRPVRERDPEQVVATVERALEKSGQDEVSLTALSTADVSCISPLIKRLVEKTAPERVSLSVASLRAYGLAEELLDDMRKVRTAGLTFAPEAGTQRMRDVINKNVTEQQLMETAERVFSRGFDRMKLYFILGLPTETDEDVLGIAEVGKNAMAVGKRIGKRAKVTVSVSVHVPKPHTPFQWCKMDDLQEVKRKQYMLRDELRRYKSIGLRLHDSTTSELEGVLARGDRRLGDVIERAYQHGAFFDSWDDQFKKDTWMEAFAHFGIDTAPFLMTLPLDARLPWDHIDVGLEDGFLAREYRKALQSRLSPPCGKAKGMFIHHTNVAEANDDARKLVCYDCGIACDLTRMREQRVGFLQKMGADRPGKRAALPIYQDPVAPVKAKRAEAAEQRDRSEPQPSTAEASTTEPAEAAEQRGRRVPAADQVGGVGDPADRGVRSENSLLATRGAESAPLQDRPQRKPEAFRPPRPGSPPVRVRLNYEKTGPMALLGHLDFIRELPRVIRRAGVRTAYTEGFHPKPDMSFGPALALGVSSIDEYIDIKLIDPPEMPQLITALNQAASGGLRFVAAAVLGERDPGLAKIVDAARFVIGFSADVLACAGRSSGDDARGRITDLVARFESSDEVTVERDVKGIKRKIDVKAGVWQIETGDDAAHQELIQSGVVGVAACFSVTVGMGQSGSVRPREIVEAIVGADVPFIAARAALLAHGRSPLDLEAHKKPIPVPKTKSLEVSASI